MDLAAIRAFTVLASLAAATTLDLDLNGKITNLTNMLHPLTGSISQHAYYGVTGINDRGQALVLATNSNSDFRSFLLTPSGLPLPTAPNSNLVFVPVTVGPDAPPGAPVPEPSASALFVVVFAALGTRRHTGQGWALTECASRVRCRRARSKAWFHKALTLMRHGGNHHHQ
jgi:hypothetical protein